MTATRRHRPELLTRLATQGYRALQHLWDGVDGHGQTARLGGRRVLVVRGADGAELYLVIHLMIASCSTTPRWCGVGGRPPR